LLLYSLAQFAVTDIRALGSGDGLGDGLALGLGLGTSDGDGDGLGTSDGDGDGLGTSDGDGDGLGTSDGDGDGLGEGSWASGLAATPSLWRASATLAIEPFNKAAIIARIAMTRNANACIDLVMIHPP
jgi:hypothetical protein